MSGQPSRNILVEVFRETFPKNLRFDKPCQILYAECYSISKRYKHKKYIPRTEIESVLNEYAAMPGRPCLQLPVIRQLLFIRVINAGRTFSGEKSWLYTRGVEDEYARIERWMEHQSKVAAARAKPKKRSAYAAPSSSVTASRYVNMVERELFDKEVLGTFHVAIMYQRMVRYGVVIAALLVLLAFASVNTDYVVQLYCRYWRRMGRAEVMVWMREITRRHTSCDIPDAYKSILPVPCFSYTNKAGVMCYGVNIAELVSQEKGVTVVCVPCPQMGDKRFFEQVGQVATICDAVVMEGVRFEDIDRISPAALLPLKDNTFPALGVHHRFLDILRTAGEPPMLYPGGSNVSWKAWLQQLVIPFEVRCVYNPTELSATKGEARVGWGRLRDVIDEKAAVAAASRAKDTRSYVIAVPWTVNQVVNLEASLAKSGFKVNNVFPIHWIEEDHLGRNFCDYYGISDGAADAPPAARTAETAS